MLPCGTPTSPLKISQYLSSSLLNEGNSETTSFPDFLLSKEEKLYLTQKETYDLLILYTDCFRKL